MANQSVSFENDVLVWLKNEATRTGHTFSFMVNYFCKYARDRRMKEKPQMLECAKHPGSSYSPRLPECPLCAEERTIREIEDRDSMIKFERKRLSEEIAIKQKSMETLANELNKMDPENTEQSKRDKLNAEFDATAEELRQLKTKLQELS
jgi:hypothetical protein